jgi:hypothetical protein
MNTIPRAPSGCDMSDYLAKSWRQVAFCAGTNSAAARLPACISASVHATAMFGAGPLKRSWSARSSSGSSSPIPGVLSTKLDAEPVPLAVGINPLGPLTETFPLEEGTLALEPLLARVLPIVIVKKLVSGTSDQE